MNHLTSHCSAYTQMNYTIIFVDMYLQESQAGVNANVETLPTVSQFNSLHPERRILCYDYECLVIDEEVEVSIAQFLSVSETSLTIVTWDPSSNTLHALSLLVSVMQPIYIAVCVHVFIQLSQSV